MGQVHSSFSFSPAARAAAHPPRRCRACGCTDDNCGGCVERTGAPCHWVEADLCSACVPAPTVSAIAHMTGRGVDEIQELLDGLLRVGVVRAVRCGPDVTYQIVDERLEPGQLELFASVGALDRADAWLPDVAAAGR